MKNSSRHLSHHLRRFSTVQTALRFDIPSDATIFSAIQPTGSFHLGNYLGAVRSWKDISDDSPKSAKIFFAVADLHAITIPKEPLSFKQLRIQAIASILATGVDPERCAVYQQSSVPEHTELNWILNCLCGMGYLNRMTQWKSKGNLNNSQSLTNANDEALSKISAGVFNYPILQAADILLYKSTHVPVGDDQGQHLELCRHLATQFNNHYKPDYFTLPKTLFTPAKKILSLRNPSKKMSKSDIDKSSTIFMNEEPVDIKKKIAKAQTDSIQGEIYFDAANRPGVSNLINIISGINKKTIAETVDDLKFVKDHKMLKDYTSELIIEEFSKPKALYDKLINDPGYLNEVSLKGTETARETAAHTISEVKALVGFV